MRLVECNFDDIKNCKIGYHRNEAMKIIEEFANSNMTCARVEDYHYVNAHSCYATLYNAAKRGHYDSIKVVKRNGRVYLLKKHVKE